jgi:hypothetical protein
VLASSGSGAALLSQTPTAPSRACPVRACGRRRPDRSTRAPAGWRRQLRQKVGEAAAPRGAARLPCRPPTTTPRPASCNPPSLPPPLSLPEMRWFPLCG